MEEKNKAQDQIVDELRRQIAALEAERQQAEQVARESRQYLTRLIESSPDAIISTDKEGNVVLFSEGAETVLGYRAKEVTGRNISMLYGDEAGPRQIAREMRKRGGSVHALRASSSLRTGTTFLSWSPLPPSSMRRVMRWGQLVSLETY